MAVRTPERLEVEGEEYLRRRVFSTAAAATTWRDQVRGLGFLAVVREFPDSGETFHAVYVRNPKVLPWKLVNTYAEDHE